MSALNRNQIAGLLTLVLLTAAVAILRLLIDRDPFTGEVSLAMPEPSYAHLRWTALAVGLVVGAGLAVCGVILQALLRNPLAEPFILGLSSGAGLGVMAAMYAVHAIGGFAWLGESHSVPAIARSSKRDLAPGSREPSLSLGSRRFKRQALPALSPSRASSRLAALKRAPSRGGRSR